MNFNKIVVFDFETDGPDPRVCNPVQIASLVIEPRKLEIIPDSEFVSDIRPANFDDEDYAESHWDTICWHAKNYKCKPEEIVEKWRDAPLAKSVFSSWKEYLEQYHLSHAKKKSKFTAPIAAGANILRFDLKILERIGRNHGLCDKDDELDIFHPRDKLDTMLATFLWFENRDDLKSYSMDAIRKLLGMKDKGAHDALVDVRDSAEYIIRLLKLHRRYAPKVKFKNACSIQEK